MSDSFAWNDIYSVDVPEIDQQHKKFFGLLNDLAAAINEGKGKDAVDKVLAGIVDYTVVHFSYEEKEMVRCGYPDYPQHKKVHDEFAARAQDTLRYAQASETVASMDVMFMLKNWLLNHILKQDKLYGPSMRQQKAA